jgi:hypothetical protein
VSSARYNQTSSSGRSVSYYSLGTSWTNYAYSADVKYHVSQAALKNTPTPGSEQIQATPLASRRLEAGRNPLPQPRGPRG